MIHFARNEWKIKSDHQNNKLKLVVESKKEKFSLVRRIRYNPIYRLFVLNKYQKKNIFNSS